jgi:hypothetical protein
LKKTRIGLLYLLKATDLYSKSFFNNKQQTTDNKHPDRAL